VSEAVTEAAPYEFTARLAVVLDVKSPLSYLALGPTTALADELGIDVDWLPMERSPMTPPPERSGDRGVQHLRLRALYYQGDVKRYANARGLVIRNIHRASDSSLAGAGLLIAKAHAGSSKTLQTYLERVFARHWDETLNIEDARAIEALLKECGVPDPDLSAHRAEYDALQARFTASGLLTTPAYQVDGELYYGRAHLPMIRWILEGRRGRRPI
jgi:2-hydroxychromene-2-carboxylate isomerase